MAAEAASASRSVPHGGRTIAFALVMLACVAAAAEYLARTERVQAVVLTPRWGTGLPQLEFGLARLDRLAADDPLDCLFLGSSVVAAGVDPASFAAAYTRVSGRSIRCFSAGVPALPAAAAGRIADLLVDRYHPALLVYVVLARDFSAFAGPQVSAM